MPAVPLREGNVIYLDRAHLAIAAKLPPGERGYAAKVMSVTTDDAHPGYLFVQAYSEKRGRAVMFAVPPKGLAWIGPKVRVIR